MTITAPPVVPSTPAPNGPTVESFRGEHIVNSLDQTKFELLLRTLDAVVLSNAFSRAGLQQALRLSPADAGLMTSVLESIGVIRAGGFNESREVLAEITQLPLMQTRLGGCREARNCLP
jgi:hypothetical protein